MPLISRLAGDENNLSKRYGYDCPYGYSYGGDGYCYYSGWYYWGRWVLLAVIIVVFFLIFLSFSCIQARRRRRRGQQPVMGTGWMAPPGHGPAQYTGNNYNQQYQPPSYPPPGGANADYYAGGPQDTGVAAPASTYQPQRGGEPVYVPPEGPPPSKH